MNALRQAVESTPAAAATPWPDRRLSSALAAAATTLEREQLPTGEMPTYVQAGGRLEYRRSPLLSTFVHDALARFDPASSWMERELLDALAPAARARLIPAAGRLRRRLRAFLAWDEQADGTWRLLGRGSGLGPDADATACAAAAVLQARTHGGERRWRRHVAALVRLRPAIEQSGPAEQANALRLLALVGEEVTEPAERLLERIAEGALDRPSERYPGWTARLFCVVRAWTQGGLPRRDELAAALPDLLERQLPDGGFGRPLDTALALWCLVELGHRGPEAARAADALLAARGPDGGWPYQAMFEHGGGSFGLSTSLAMAALAAAATRAAEGGE